MGQSALCRGCRNNPFAAAGDVSDHQGAGVGSVMGEGHDPAVIDSLKGLMLIAGHCAIREVGESIARLGKAKVYQSGYCNDLSATARRCSI